jgi:hypothetical protein
VLLFVPRKESLVLGKVDHKLLHSHLFYQNPNDIFQLVSFTGQKAVISKGRVYLLGLINIPPGKDVWSVESSLWFKFELPLELG